MKLSDLSYDSIRTANFSELYEIAEKAGIQDDERLTSSEDLRERLMLIKRKMDGSIHVWKPMFRSVKEDTQAKIESLVQLMKTVEETFQTIPTESISKILRKEGHLRGRNLLEEITMRIKNLTERRSLVVVAGETNGGKSTFLNLLLGEDILPTYVLHCTFAICKIVYSDVYSIKTLDQDGVEEYFPCSSREEVKTILQNKVTQPETKEREIESQVKEITLGVPADILKSGVILVDTPGIGENDAMDTVTMNFVKSTHASAFIYIIKSDTAGGVQEDRLLSFLQAIKDRYSSDAMVEAFDPRAAMFVCHRWDNINEKQREKVRMNALSKLEDVWPGFDPSQMFFFSSTGTMKHLPVDPAFVTDSFMVLLKGLKNIFDRAGHNAIKNQYVWLKYMLQPASRHLKSMITHCIMSNEELEEYFKSVAEKQNKLMVSSTENSRKLKGELDKMSWELKALLASHLNFDSSSPRSEVEEWEEIMEICSTENFFVSQANRRALDEMIVRSLLRRVDKSVSLQKVVSEMESKILISIQEHLGLFRCQIKQIKHVMLHPKHSPSGSLSSLDMDDSSDQFGTSTDSIPSIRSNSSSIENFRGIHNPDPSQLSVTVKSLLLRRKEGKSTMRINANNKHEIRQSLLGKIGDRIKHGVMHRIETAVYIEERIRKISKDIRENMEIMDSIINGYTVWIQQCMTYAVESIPNFIEVNTKLMDEIRDHRSIFQRNKDLLVKVMENLEPCRHHLKGYGMLYMDDINAETLAFNTEHRYSTVSLPKYLLTESGRSFDSGIQGSITDGKIAKCLWARMQGATIEIDNIEDRVVIKTYTHDMDEKVILPEIASLRCLEYANLAPFLGMTRISAESSKGQSSSSGEPDSNVTEKVSAFIFKGDLMSARAYSRRRKVNMQQFIPEMVHSLLRALNYIHREGLVHMELNLRTVMVDKINGAVKLCHMCKPREATFPDDLDIPTKSYVCLSPNALEGNVYESTDDIYALGLLLWELLFPDQLPFKEQRLWTLKRFIEECHPTNMLQENMIALEVSQRVQEVLKGTLLTSRGSVCMSISTIQSQLAGLDNEPVVTRVRSYNKLLGIEEINTISLPAPDVKVISPSGTGKKLEFMFDDIPYASDGSSTKNSETRKLPITKTNSGNLASMIGDPHDKNVTGLLPPKQNRSVSEPDIRLAEDSSVPKAKSSPLKIFQRFLRFGSSKKSKAEELKHSEASKEIANSDGRRRSTSTLDSTDDSKRNSVELEYSTPQLRPRFRSHNPVKEIQFNPLYHEKHNSLPDQRIFQLKSGSLTRKESFDVPTLMSEKFRHSVGNRRQRNIASRLNPLSNFQSDLSMSGSVPSLLPLNKSTGNVVHYKGQCLAAYLTSSLNPKIQAQMSPASRSQRTELTIPHDASWCLTHGLHYGGSLQDLSVNNLSNSVRPVMKDQINPADSHDKLSGGNFARVNHISPTRKHSFRYIRQPSPLAANNHNGISLPTDSSISKSAVLADMATADNKSNVLSSSSTSSRGADSGFSTDASGRGVRDFYGSCDDMQTTSHSLGGSVIEKYSLNYETDYNFKYRTSQNGQHNNFGKNMDQCTGSSLYNSMELKEDLGDSSTVKRRSLSLVELPDNNLLLHKYMHSQRTEQFSDSNTSIDSTSIPPPPTNIAELSFSQSSYDSESDE